MCITIVTQWLGYSIWLCLRFGSNIKINKRTTYLHFCRLLLSRVRVQAISSVCPAHWVVVYVKRLITVFEILLSPDSTLAQRWTRIGSIRGSGRVGSDRVTGQTCHCRNFFHYFSLKLNLICCSKCGFVIPITAAAEASGFGFLWLGSAGGNLWLWDMPPIDDSVCHHCIKALSRRMMVINVCTSWSVHSIKAASLWRLS